jgi:putative flavoprotein involved in K+ transport
MTIESDPLPSSVPPVIVVGGGQSGLAAARALRELRVPTVILEASDRPTGSWPRYYDSLRVFSPAGYSSMPGIPFPGAPEHYPGRDEVTDYLEQYAARLDVEIQTDTRVETIQQDGKAFLVLTDDGRVLAASGIVAASGSFSNPYRPSFPGEETFTGELSHVADYRNPTPYAGQRVIVVGAGTPPRRSPTNSRRSRRPRLPHAIPCGSSPNASVAMTSTTGFARPASTPCRGHG